MGSMGLARAFTVPALKYSTPAIYSKNAGKSSIWCEARERNNLRLREQPLLPSLRWDTVGTRRIFERRSQTRRRALLHPFLACNYPRCLASPRLYFEFLCLLELPEVVSMIRPVWILPPIVRTPSLPLLIDRKYVLFNLTAA